MSKTIYTNGDFSVNTVVPIGGVKPVYELVDTRLDKSLGIFNSCDAAVTRMEYVMFIRETYIEEARDKFKVWKIVFLCTSIPLYVLLLVAIVYRCNIVAS